MTHPNFLFIQADQLSARALPAYGNAVAKTPNIDKLAATGVTFDHAYCNYPLCAPSRFSMISELLATNARAYDNGAEYPAGLPSFAHYLRLLGYQTSVSGKMHFIGPDQLHGFEERVTTDIYPADFNWIANDYWRPRAKLTASNDLEYSSARFNWITTTKLDFGPSVKFMTSRAQMINGRFACSLHSHIRMTPSLSHRHIGTGIVTKISTCQKFPLCRAINSILIHNVYTIILASPRQA